MYTEVDFTFREGIEDIDKANYYMEYIINLIRIEDEKSHFERIFVPFLDNDDESRLLFIALSTYSQLNSMIEFLFPPYSEELDWFTLNAFYNASLWTKQEFVQAVEKTSNGDVLVLQNYFGQELPEELIFAPFARLNYSIIKFILKELYNIESKGEINE